MNFIGSMFNKILDYNRTESYFVYFNDQNKIYDFFFVSSDKMKKKFYKRIYIIGSRALEWRVQHVCWLI